MARYLLDTHVWLWLQAAPERIPSDLLDALADDTNELLLSAASSWELTIKHALGKIDLPDVPARYIPDRMRSSSTLGLPIDHRHAWAVADLPPLHRDPFDRLLVAQARVDALTLVTADAAVAAYDRAIVHIT